MASKRMWYTLAERCQGISADDTSWLRYRMTCFGRTTSTRGGGGGVGGGGAGVENVG